MRQLLRRVLMELQSLFGETETAMPRHALLLPVLEPLHIRAGLDKELHLHLLEFTSSKNEVPGRDFIPEGFADLGDAERHLLTHRLLHVEKVHINTLRRFRAQEDLRRRVFDGPHEGPEHQVK